MARIPTMDEQVGNPLQTGVDTRGLSTEANASAEGQASITNLLLSQARSATSNASSSTISAIERQEQLERTVRRTNVLLDAREASSQLLLQAKEQALKTGKPVDTKTIRQSLDKFLKDRMAGFDDDLIKQTSIEASKLVSDTVGVIDKLNEQVIETQIKQTESRVVNQALGNFLNVENGLTEEGLIKSIAEVKDFYERLGYSGNALRNLVDQTEQQFSSVFASTLIERLKLDVPAMGKESVAMTEDGRMVLVPLAQAYERINKMNLAPLEKEKLLQEVGKVNNDGIMYLQRADKQALDQEVNIEKFLNGGFAVGSKDAKDASNALFNSVALANGLDTAGGFIPLATAPDQVYGAVKKYFEQFPTATRMPEMAVQHLNSLAKLEDEQIAPAATQLVALYSGDPDLHQKFKASADEATSFLFDWIRTGGHKLPVDMQSYRKKLSERPELLKTAQDLSKPFTNVTDFTPWWRVDLNFADFGREGLLLEKAKNYFEQRYVITEDENLAKAQTESWVLKNAKKVTNPLGSWDVIDMWDNWEIGRDEIMFFMPNGELDNDLFAEQLQEQWSLLRSTQGELLKNTVGKDAETIKDLEPRAWQPRQTGVNLEEYVVDGGKVYAATSYNLFNKDTGQLLSDESGRPFVFKYVDKTRIKGNLAAVQKRDAKLADRNEKLRQSQAALPRPIQ